MFTGVNNKHSRIFFALAWEGRYAIRSLQFTSRPQEPDSHDGWIRGKGIPLFHENPKFEIRNPKQIRNSKSETTAGCLGFRILCFDHEIRNKFEIRDPKPRARFLGFRISCFEFVSDFVLRISCFGFRARHGWPCPHRGASLNSGGCFLAWSGGNCARSGETRKHLTDPTGRA